MKKRIGLLLTTLLLVGCGANPETQDKVLEGLKQGALTNTDFAEFLETNGEKLKKANFEPEAIGIAIPSDAELDSSFYDEIIVGLSEIARESTEDATLAYLATHANGGVRSDVAKNPAISSELQIALSKDENSLVRSYLGANPKLGAEVATALSVDKSESVRRPLAQNANVVPETLQLFVADENPEVQRSLARNKSLTPELMVQIVEKSADPAVSELIKRTDLPADLLEKIRTERPQLFENPTE